MSQICHEHKFLHVHVCQYYASYEPNLINNVTWNTVIHTHIISIYSYTNMPVTLHIHFQLHWYYNVHIDTKLVKIYVKKKAIKLLFTMLLPHVCKEQICPLNAINKPHMQISPCAHISQLCQYTCLI